MDLKGAEIRNILEMCMMNNLALVTPPFLQMETAVPV